jgi:hypothetical protein
LGTLFSSGNDNLFHWTLFSSREHFSLPGNTVRNTVLFQGTVSSSRDTVLFQGTVSSFREQSSLPKNSFLYLGAMFSSGDCFLFQEKQGSLPVNIILF